MGVPGLKNFIKKQFARWLPVNDFREWSHVIIDGSGVCYSLYFLESLRWDLGGEYASFGQAVHHFFQSQSFRFKHPIVVFDGCAGHSESKMATSRSRREGSMKSMHKLQQSQAVVSAGSSNICKPLMLISAFMDALRSLNIEFHVADGEADTMIAALANHYECPVLGSDSDFFVFNLRHGIVDFDRYYVEKQNKALFSIREFMKQFHLREYEQCLLLPARFGNDFMTSPAAGNFQKSFTTYFKVLDQLSQCRSSREYLRRESSDKLRANFEAAEKFYSVIPLPHCLHVANSPTTNEKFIVLPAWVFDSFERGIFPPSLINVFHNKLYLLPLVVEVIDMDSAWLVSRAIRQQLYGFMGLQVEARVTEVLRESRRPVFCEEFVEPKHLQEPAITIGDRLFLERDAAELSRLVLSVLDFPTSKSVFERLEERWKLPMAATFYWYHHLLDKSVQDRKKLVESLLLSFLACSNLVQLDHIPFADPVAPDTRAAHLAALHAFAQWQCVYYDARALNFLAREPFPTVSPASLYSGRLTMYFTTVVSHEGGWLSGILPSGSNQLRLFNELLCVVT